MTKRQVDVLTPVMCPGTFSRVLEECVGLFAGLLEHEHRGQRLSMELPTDSFSFSALMDATELRDRCSEFAGSEVQPADFPVELRKYFSGSAGMGWHRDAGLYECPQVEYTLMLQGPPSACLEWQTEDGHVQRLPQVINQACLVRAGGVLHRVPPLHDGTKLILKGCFAIDGRKTERHGRFLEELRRRSNALRSRASRGCLSSFVFQRGG